MAKTNNPHNAKWLSADMADTLNTISRVDEKGVLYEMNYSADYYDPVILEAAKKAADKMTMGCSAFSVCNMEMEYLMCRNYDYHHKDRDGAYTGLNVVVHTAPEGKLRSIGVCDAYWLDPSAYYAGALDDGKTDISAMVLAPYTCVDAMNEAGLAASLLVVDLKQGESYTNQNTGKPRMIHSVLLRHIIDNARSIEEAVKIAESTDIYSAGISDLHMYLSQKDGSSAVLEWRQYGEDRNQKLRPRLPPLQSDRCVP